MLEPAALLVLLTEQVFDRCTTDKPGGRPAGRQPARGTRACWGTSVGFDSHGGKHVALSRKGNHWLN